MQAADPNNPPPKFRKLRIAWSVFWGLACVLLIVLWVRSYWYWDQLYTPICTAAYNSPSWEGKVITIESDSGALSATYAIGGDPWYWHISHKLDETRATIAPYNYAIMQPPETHRSFVGFAVYREFGLNPTIRIPIWFTVLTTSAIGCISWLPWWSKRFSLRTLLIATTLVAV